MEFRPNVSSWYCKCGKNFLQDIILPIPEFENIKSLLEQSYLGLSFFGETKNIVVET
jgi:hypothetical protein